GGCGEAVPGSRGHHRPQRRGDWPDARSAGARAWRSYPVGPGSQMRRGEVWWADLPLPVGNRPVVVLTRDAVLATIGAVVVALVTRTVRDLPTEVVLGRKQGLPVRSVANLDNIPTVPRGRLIRWMGSCDGAKVQEIHQ